jgi:hypothetical protein
MIKHTTGNVSVNDTLRVQPTRVSLGGPGVWIERIGGGLVYVRQDEIDGLIDALKKGGEALSQMWPNKEP